jgi:hypothetical protein
MSAAFETEPLLELARIVLERANFVAERIDVQSGEPTTGETHALLLAQDSFFILAVGAAATIDGLGTLEQAAVFELTRRAAGSQLGAKQWDLYLVLLTAQPAVDDGRASSQLVALNYNTRSIRRLAHAGVTPTLEAMERTLRPFLPLPEVTNAAVLEDALTLLENELTREGVEADLAGRAIAAFRDSGSLSSV